MAKRRLIIEAIPNWDTSAKGMAFGIYSYTAPGPWAGKIIEFVTEVNKKLPKHRQLRCWISKFKGPHLTLMFKGKKNDIEEAVNYYLSNSKILESFNVELKR